MELIDKRNELQKLKRLRYTTRDNYNKKIKQCQNKLESLKYDKDQELKDINNKISQIESEIINFESGLICCQCRGEGEIIIDNNPVLCPQCKGNCFLSN